MRTMRVVGDGLVTAVVVVVVAFVPHHHGILIHGLRPSADHIVRPRSHHVVRPRGHAEPVALRGPAPLNCVSRRQAFLASAAALLPTVASGTVARASSEEPCRAAHEVRPNEEGSALPTLSVAAAAAAVTTPPSSSSAWEESLSGFVAGAALAATKTVVKYPLDTATVRLQLPTQQYSIQNLPALFQGSMNGVATPLVANIPAAAVFFAVKDACKPILKSAGLPSWAQTCVAVAVAQPPFWLVRNPSEVVKTRQQAKVPGYEEGISMLQGYNQVRLDALEQQAPLGNNNTSPLSTAATLVDAFYLGYWENIWYAYPADVIKFLVYDQWAQRLGGKSNMSPMQGAVAGAVSTAIAQFLTTPLDVVRNRLMVDGNQATSSGGDDGTALTTTTEKKGDDASRQEKDEKPSYWESLQHLAETEGLPGLFAGATPRVGKAIVSGAIQFATYEQTKQDIARFLQGSRPSPDRQ